MVDTHDLYLFIIFGETFAAKNYNPRYEIEESIDHYIIIIFISKNRYNYNDDQIVTVVIFGTGVPGPHRQLFQVYGKTSSGVSYAATAATAAAITAAALLARPWSRSQRRRRRTDRPAGNGARRHRHRRQSRTRTYARETTAAAQRIYTDGV